MIIDFKRNNHVFNHVNGKELSVVESVKILGLTVSSQIQYNVKSVAQTFQPPAT